MSKIVSKYIQTPENKQQLCRNEHDIKSLQDLKNPPEPPDIEFMLDALYKARMDKKLKA